MTPVMQAGRHCSVRADQGATRLILIRHARTELHGRFCGHLDPPLSRAGENEVLGIAERLASLRPAHIWSSDLLRAMQTAAPVSERFGLSFDTSAALREMNFGEWEGLSWKEIETRFPADALAWSRSFPHHRPPGGESFSDFRQRVITELHRLANATEKHALVFTHAGFIRAAVIWVLGIPDHRILRVGLDHGSATVIEKTGKHWMVAALNSGQFAFGSSCNSIEDGL